MFNKTDFNLPLDQHIEKINQLIEKTEDLIQFYHDFCVYNRLPKELKKGQNWLSKYYENKQKFKEFKIEWNNFQQVLNNFYKYDYAPTCGILDEEIVSELEYRHTKLIFYAATLRIEKRLISERENASRQACNLQPSNSLDADPVKCLKESENYEATQPANQTCLEERGNTDATDLEPDSQTMKATDQDTSQPAVSGTMKVDWETTPTDSQQTGNLDNGVTDLKTAAKDKCEIFWCCDWGKNHNKDYKTFRDKVYNYTTWKFKEERRATVDLLLIFLIMLGRWMRDGIHNHERWDTQSYKSHRYLQWSNDFKHETGHDKKLFGYLKFKFKTCQPFLGLTLFR